MNLLPTTLPAPFYAYDRDADGCDDLWVIYEVHTGTDIASITFWGSDDEWTARAERKARRWVARLNRGKPLQLPSGR